MKITIDGKPYEVEIRPGEVLVEGKSYPVRSARTGNQVSVEIGGNSRQVELKGDSVVVDGKAYAVALEAAEPAAAAPAAAPRPVAAAPAQAPAPRQAPAVAPRPAPMAPPKAAAPRVAAPAGNGAGTPIKAPMPGKLLRVLVKEGDKVGFGSVLMVLEAMKMENEIRSTVGGTVRSVPVSAGLTVNANDTLAVIQEG
ncbi:MAG: acyl-CoA carboxylase biotin carboxyl carrier protein subunit [Chloroflexota bacterium]